MIYEPKTERNHSLWIGGYLPNRNDLIEIISNLHGNDRLLSVDDTTLVESIEDVLSKRYSSFQHSRQNMHENYVHLLRPDAILGYCGSFNPIQHEKHEYGNRQNYRLIGLFSREALDNNASQATDLKQAFIDTVHDHQMVIRDDKSYSNQDGVKAQLTELSKYILDSHYFPHAILRRGLKNLGFESEEFTL